MSIGTGVIRMVAKMRRLNKAKKLAATNKGRKVSNISSSTGSVAPHDVKMLNTTALSAIPTSAALSPIGAGAVTGVVTSRIGQIAGKRSLNTVSKNFPKWIGNAKTIDAQVVTAVKTGTKAQAWNLAKRGAKVGLSVAGWGVAGYYFDKAIAHILGDDDEKDKAGMSGEDAVDAAQALADEIHGLADGWPIGMNKKFDLSRDAIFMQMYGDFEDSLLRGRLLDAGMASVRMNDGFDDHYAALLVHRAIEAVKDLCNLAENSNSLKLLALQGLLSDDNTIVPPLGFQVVADDYKHNPVAETIAEGHFDNIANFVEEYRNDAAKKAFDVMTDAVQLFEDKADFIKHLMDPDSVNHKLAVYLLSSFSNDKFEDIAGWLRTFTVDGDGNDDESEMLNFIARAKQRSYAAISIINKTNL